MLIHPTNNTKKVTTTTTTDTTTTTTSTTPTMQHLWSLIPLLLVVSSGVHASPSPDYLRSKHQDERSSKEINDQQGYQQQQQQQQQQQHRTLPQNDEPFLRYDSYECSSTLIEFQSVVFMEFNHDLLNLTNVERSLLEQNFMETYNGLTMALCDAPYHRYIESVTLEWPPSPSTNRKRRRRQRQLQDTSTAAAAATTTTTTEATPATARTELSFALQNDTTTTTTGNEAIDEDAALLAQESSNQEYQSQQQQPLQSESQQQSQQQYVDIARFFVNVVCHNCPTNSTLFVEASSSPSLTTSTIPPLTSMLTPFSFKDIVVSSNKRQQQQQQESSTTTTFIVQQPNNKNNNDNDNDAVQCQCVRPTMDMMQPLRPPTIQEFRLAYNHTIASVDNDGNGSEYSVVNGQVVHQDDENDDDKEDKTWEIEELVEVDVVNCSSNVTQFSSSIVANLQGNLVNMSDNERRALERTFLETYNSLNFQRCERFFRQIIDVKLISAQDGRGHLGNHGGGNEEQKGVQNRRQLLINDDFDQLYTGNDKDENDDGYERDDLLYYGNGTNFTTTTNKTWLNGNATTIPAPAREDASSTTTTTTNVPAVYRVIGQCRGCAVSDSGSFNLFDDTLDKVLRRQLRGSQQQQSSQQEGDATSTSWLPADTLTSPFQPDRFSSFDHSHGRFLLDLANVCLCPSYTVEQIEPQAVTEQEFQDKYSTKVDELQQEGILTSVEKVEDVANDEDACKEEFLEVHGVYAVTFRYELEGAVSRRSNLVDAFRVAYQTFGRDVCGPFLDEVRVIRETDGDVVQVFYSTISLQTLPGKIFYQVEPPVYEEERDDKRKIDDVEEEYIPTEEELFVRAFNAFLIENSLDAQAMTVAYVLTPAPSVAPTTLPPASMPVVMLPSSNATSESRNPEKDYGKDDSGGVGEAIPVSDSNPPKSSGKSGVNATQAPNSAPPTLPPTESPTESPTRDWKRPKLPTQAPVPRPPSIPTSRPASPPTGGNTDAQSTVAPTTVLEGVKDTVDETVAEVVEAVGTAVETVVGYIVPIVEDTVEFLDEVEDALEKLFDQDLPDIPNLPEILGDIDESVDRLSGLSIPGLPETTQRIHETVNGILGLLQGSSPSVPDKLPATIPPGEENNDDDRSNGEDEENDDDNDEKEKDNKKDDYKKDTKPPKGEKSNLLELLWKWVTPISNTPSPTPGLTLPPTPTPTRSPVTVVLTATPTAAPTTKGPTFPPTVIPTSEPTVVPVTTETTKPEQDIEPTLPPSRSTAPSVMPLEMTSSPTVASASAPSTNAPRTLQPSISPTPARSSQAPIVSFIQFATDAREVSDAPTAQPTQEPTQTPTTNAPRTLQPSISPSLIQFATDAPTAQITREVSDAPTAQPTEEPAQTPTAEPTFPPTLNPTDTPTVDPTSPPAVAETGNQQAPGNGKDFVDKKDGKKMKGDKGP